jgi:hypothetical protein
MRAFFLMVPLVVSACNSARIAGGRVVESGTEPAGLAAGAWTPSDCRDARGEPSAFGAGVVEVKRLSDGRFVLVETRPDYDSLVVHNSFVRGRERVFQLALKTSGSAPYLREYRLPVSGSGPGRLVIAARHWNSRDTADGFVAWYEAKPAVTCTLHDSAGGTPAPARRTFMPIRVKAGRGAAPQPWARVARADLARRAV